MLDTITPYYTIALLTRTFTVIKVSSFNVRGVNNDLKRVDVFEYLKKLGSNIYCLQDIHCGTQQINKFKNGWDGDMIIAHNTSNSRGVAILFNKNFEYNIIDTILDPRGNYVAIKLRMFETDISLISMYGPNIDDPAFYDKIGDILNDFDTPSIILCGDWNTVQNQNLDTKHYMRDNNVRARDRVNRLKEEYELVDPWRVNNPNKRQFTWFQRNPTKMARLDYFFISADIMARTDKTEIKPGYRSDHSIINLDLKINNQSRGKGFWKFNTSLLHDQEYSQLIKQVIRENIERYALPEQNLEIHDILFQVSDQLFFETLKMEIRTTTISYSSRKKRERDREEYDIKLRIEILSNKPQIEQEDLIQIHQLSEKLQGIRNNKIKGMLLRSKVQWVEEGEKPSKYFASLEKKNYINKLINKLDIGGKIIENEETVLLETSKFYKNLYSSQINHTEHSELSGQFLGNHLLKKLSEEQKQSCEGNITTIEIKNILKDMKHDKTPGIDGIPIEFYKFFWNDLGHFLVRSIQSAFATGELSITQKRGIITCIPKADKPRVFLKNWRPISLLTSDYKLITSVMAKRMKGILQDIIGSDQRGFLKDRYIEENTRLIYDLINYCKENKKEGLLLLIDFEKAFDSIEWVYIRKVLKKYNFGPDLIKWFNIVYKNSESCVINNGKYSTFFKLERGCRQGDPWSPYIFILIIEPLAQYIKHNVRITGLSFGNQEIKLGQYADDTFIVMDGSRRSILETMQTFKDFKKVSGLSINVDKTQVVKLGNLNNILQNCPILGVPYSGTFKLLGIHFSTNLDDMYELNFRNKIDSIKKLVRIYQGRNFSMVGRITLVKMYMLPKLIHILAVLPMPNSKDVKEISEVFSKFIWNDKKPKIKLSTIAQDYKAGGQKMIHLESFCKASKLAWVKKINHARDDNSWKILAQHIFKEKSIPIILEGSTQNVRQLAKQLRNKFWKDVLNNWAIYRDLRDKNNQDEVIQNTVIWASGFIKNENLLARKNYYMANGLKYLKDMLNFDTLNFKSIPVLQQQYNINMTFFDHLCLINSIPRRIKQAISRHRPPIVDCAFGMLVSDICNAPKVCRYAYTFLVQQLTQDINAKTKWENIIGHQLENKEWEHIFVLPNTTTLDATLRTFQYKIIHRVLPSNKLLHTYNIRAEPWCDDCNNTPETLEHLFHLCPHKLTLWYQVADWLAPNIDLYQYINTENILLGIYNGARYLENDIILLVKRFIYIKKCNNEPINLAGLKYFLKHHFNLEINSLCQRRRMRNIDKWDPIAALISQI